MISIIIPVYNVEKYIRECLESVAAQTYTDLEVILVDDCGTDGSMRVVKEFVDTYDGPIKFKVIRHERNRGLSAARNTGIDVAQGEYISFIDSDDYIAPGMYERFVDAFAKAEGNVQIVSCLCVTDTEGVISEAFSSSSEPYYIAPEQYAEKLLLMQAPHMAWGKLYKADLFSHVRYREGRNNEDILFALDSYQHIESAGISMYVIPDRLYYYRIRPGSICTSSEVDFSDVVIENSIEVIASVRNQKPDLTEKLLKDLLLQLYFPLMEFKKKSHPKHCKYKVYCKHLASIPNRIAKGTLTAKQFRLFLMMKYLPGLYVALKG